MYICAYPLITKTLKEVASTFVNNFILQHGVPSYTATVRGAVVMSDIIKQVFELLYIKKLNYFFLQKVIPWIRLHLNFISIGPEISEIRQGTTQNCIGNA